MGVAATAGRTAAKNSTSHFNFAGLHNPKTKSQRVTLRGGAAPLSQMILEDNMKEQIKTRKRQANASHERRE